MLNTFNSFIVSLVFLIVSPVVLANQKETRFCPKSYGLSKLARQLLQTGFKNIPGGYYLDLTDREKLKDFEAPEMCHTLLEIRRRYVEWSSTEDFKKRLVIESLCERIMENLKDINNWIQGNSDFSYQHAVKILVRHLDMQQTLVSLDFKRFNSYPVSILKNLFAERLENGLPMFIVPKIADLKDFFHAASLGFGLSDLIIDKDIETVDGNRNTEILKLDHDFSHQRSYNYHHVENNTLSRINEVERHLQIYQDYRKSITLKQRYYFESTLFISFHEGLTCLDSNEKAISFFYLVKAKQKSPITPFKNILDQLKKVRDQCDRASVNKLLRSILFVFEYSANENEFRKKRGRISFIKRIFAGTIAHLNKMKRNLLEEVDFISLTIKHLEKLVAQINAG